MNRTTIFRSTPLQCCWVGYLSNLGTLSVGINVMSQRAPNKVATHVQDSIATGIFLMQK
jgi:hypothetical protein